ncbi:MAG: Uncharacterised protein [Porticoccaceae bacterium UBA1117]|nr:MAG: Uncharacterised protein [Porticoccaceae bacterium UBA1117]
MSTTSQMLWVIPISCYRCSENLTPRWSLPVRELNKTPGISPSKMPTGIDRTTIISCCYLVLLHQAFCSLLTLMTLWLKLVRPAIYPLQGTINGSPITTRQSEFHWAVDRAMTLLSSMIRQLQSKCMETRVTIVS